ncbi:response regulator [Cyclobacterium jeungdonense]|uniref:Response regulator n=1 Tax=Cyclobacterium jeungdonense TaxID=708087 RepID=A0ABT8C692_9BACT|nr:response regulator [Cyclobacterium jeungdonense]MDN3687133.1 response regulator [Cyclobacterium jeungdonense]
MSGITGLLLLEKIKQKYPQITVSIFSAYGDVENHQRAIESGVKEFFTKPIDFKDLEITIVKTLSHVLQLRQTLQA